MTPYSVVVTTYNNADTLARCLNSLGHTDDIVILDSGSHDDTLAIAHQFGARIEHQPFRGYGAQKQAAVDLARHDWVLLLDADEALSPQLAAEIDALMQGGPDCYGYRLYRREQLFWRWQHPATKLISAVRFFHRRYGRLSSAAVHAGVTVQGKVGRLRAVLLHYGETDVHHKVLKVNAYSSGMVKERLRGRAKGLRWRMVLYPPLAFVREYVLRRQFLNGWAGFIAARVSAFYAFIKYAKLYDANQPRGDEVLDRRQQHYREPGADGRDHDQRIHDNNDAGKTDAGNNVHSYEDEG